MIRIRTTLTGMTVRCPRKKKVTIKCRQNMHARQEPWLISLMPQAKISAMSRHRNDVNEEIEASPTLKAIVSIKYYLSFCGILFGSSPFLPKYPFRAFVCLFCCFTSQVNSYGHCGTVLNQHTFSWAGLNKRLTSNLCTYFRL